MTRLSRVILTLVTVVAACAPSARADLPNIVLVLFDDLGYGQPPSYRAETTFHMPHFERLVSDGMRFIDAHSPSAVCTPTRYGLLTGRYPSRIGQFGVCTTYSPPLIPADRMTVASLLRQHGYDTACIGKWHLGLNWVDGKPGSQNRVPPGSRFTDGPNSVGFDHFYGFTHARNIGTLIEQDSVVANVAAVENQPMMIDHAIDWIDQRAKHSKPFFLYFPMCPPHTPVEPSPEFVGKSGAADLVGRDEKYGDWILQGDAMLGRILESLDRNGFADNTLIIATSDNGAEHRAYPPLRESKRSIYEGGHRVPFVARWPGRIAAGAVCQETICLTDLMATAAAIVGVRLPADAAEDSVNLLPALLSENKAPARTGTVHQSSKGDLALRSAEWKLIFFADGRRELYNIANDLSETRNVAQEHPEVVADLAAQMQSHIDRGRSTPGAVQQNEFALSIDKPGRTAKERRKTPRKNNGVK